MIFAVLLETHYIIFSILLHTSILEPYDNDLDNKHIYKIYCVCISIYIYSNCEKRNHPFTKSIQ